MKIDLIYFKMRALAEAPQLLMHYADINIIISCHGITMIKNARSKASDTLQTTSNDSSR